MTKKLIIKILFVFLAVALQAQNLQIHYDLGKDRKHFTTTLEMFRPDNWGNTFFFVDFDYNTNNVRGVSLAYMEIARGIKFWDGPFALQVEYNGGFGQFNAGNMNLAYQINDAWLTGGQYTFNTADFSKIFTMQALYKYIRDKHDFSWQLTGVWVLNFLENKISCTGFADFWREDNFHADGTVTKFIFLSEPQFWYNFNRNFSAGSEIEISQNFAGNKGFMVNPTIALKWTFN
jgi:hypothetical protein